MTPTSSNEAATKQYVDDSLDGLVGGSIASNEIAFGTGVNSVGGDPNFTFDQGTGTFSAQNADITGNLLLDGASGIAGQVLTSNGLGNAPTWEDQTSTTYTAGSGLSLVGDEFSVAEGGIVQSMLDLSSPVNSYDAATKE